MEATESGPERLLAQGVDALRALLGAEWEIKLRPANDSGRQTDPLVEVHAPGGTYAQLLLEVRQQITPRDVERMLLPKLDLLQQVGSHTHLLAVAPWISPRTQQTLRDYGIGYLDLTGNASLRISRPAIIIRARGETRTPRSSVAPRRSKPRLAGPRVGRLVRLLADVAPPYRANELAKHARLSPPYVSRVLDSLEDQLLIRREGRTITSVDWPNLLRARAEQLNLLHHNPYVGMLAPNGTAQTWTALRDLQQRVEGLRVVLTGSCAARAVAPLASGGQIMLYVPPGPHTPDATADALDLLRTEEGADVLLLRAHDEVVFERTRVIDGIRQVALSQLAIDCLSGPGRMPAEGEAVLTYMTEHEAAWRTYSFPPPRDDLLL